MQTTLRMNICGVELEQSRNKGYCMRHCDGLTNILCLLFFFFFPSEAENSFRTKNQMPYPNSCPPESLILNCNMFASAKESCFSGMRELGDRYISSQSMKPQDYTSPTPPASSHILSKNQLPSKQTPPAICGAACSCPAQVELLQSSFLCD